MAVQRGADCLGVELCAVGKNGVVADFDGDGQPVLRDVGQFGGELRHQLTVRVDVIQLLAHGLHDVARVEGG